MAIPNAPERSVFEAGLTPEGLLSIAGDLDHLRNSAGWGTLKELLRAARIKAREMAMAGPKEDIDSWKGYISALNVVEGLPEMLMTQAQEAEQVQIAKGKPSPFRGSLNSGGEDSF